MTAITLPWPGRELSPNGRFHHMAVYRAKKAAKLYAFAVAKEARLGFVAGDVPIMVQLTFHPKTKTAPDCDNAVASCKAYLDGIAEAMRIDDSFFRLRAPIMGEPRKGGAVIVEIG